jgi:RNA polymerase sigma-70 factor (ECF subfamily)
LAELPDPLREVLVLRHYEGLNFEQIARLTATPASTLKSRFSAALARLRQRLQELGWEPEEKHS